METPNQPERGMQRGAASPVPPYAELAELAEPYEAFYATARLALYGFCFRYLGDPHATEDVVQDVLLRLFERYGREPVPARDGVRSLWEAAMWRTAYRRCIDLIRGSRRTVALGQVPAPAIPAGEDEWVDWLDLKAAARDLSPLARGSMVLRDLHGLSERETVAQLGCKPNTVRHQRRPPAGRVPARGDYDKAAGAPAGLQPGAVHQDDGDPFGQAHGGGRELGGGEHDRVLASVIAGAGVRLHHSRRPHPRVRRVPLQLQPDAPAGAPLARDHIDAVIRGRRRDRDTVASVPPQHARHRMLKGDAIEAVQPGQHGRGGAARPGEAEHPQHDALLAPAPGR